MVMGRAGLSKRPRTLLLEGLMLRLRGTCHKMGSPGNSSSSVCSPARCIIKYTDTHTTAVNVLPFGEWCAEESQAQTQFLGKTLNWNYCSGSGISNYMLSDRAS